MKKPEYLNCKKRLINNELDINSILPFFEYWNQSNKKRTDLEISQFFYYFMQWIQISDAVKRFKGKENNTLEIVKNTVFKYYDEKFREGENV